MRRGEWCNSLLSLAVGEWERWDPWCGNTVFTMTCNDIGGEELRNNRFFFRFRLMKIASQMYGIVYGIVQ